MSDVIKLLETIRDEIEEYVEYIVGVESAELSGHQQKKITEPLTFYIHKIKLDERLDANNQSEGG